MENRMDAASKWIRQDSHSNQTPTRLPPQATPGSISSPSVYTVPPPDPSLLRLQPRWDERSDFFNILVEQLEMITPEFLRDLSTHVGVYDLGSFMEFFLQSPLKMDDIFPGLMMVTHGGRISNCGLLAKWLKDSPTSPLPIQLRTNSHPDWFRVFRI
jgi:hypothetical protein